MSKRVLLASALALVLPSALAAQRAEQPAPRPASPEVEALVLSGGGARGLAHAGVLLGLQQLGHDPEIVVGTSMGAVVGALYAAGYDAEEIRRRIMRVRWDAMFSPTRVLAGPERQLRDPLLSLDLDPATFRVSRGLLGQWRINRELARNLFDANSRARGDFDRLSRRYRAVAADLRTGRAVVLDSGDLARAVRASMAVPGFFAPVHWNGELLVDGAIAENLPTGVARRMGGTRITASDVARPPAEIMSLAPLSVLSRSIDLMQINAQRDTAPVDDLILPDLDPSMSAAGFPRDPAPLIAIGLAATLRDARPVTRASRPARALPPPPPMLHRVIVESPDTALAALARRTFRSVVPGSYDTAAVLRAVDVLYTTGLFEGVWPRVTGDDADAVLHVRLEGPPKQSLSLGVGYESDRGGRGWASLDQFTSVLGRPAYFTAAASSNGVERWGSFSTRVYSFSNPGLAWSLGTHVQERDVRTFDDDVLRVKEVARAGGWLGLEFPRALQQRATTAAMRAEWVDEEDGDAGSAIGPLLRFGDVDADTRIVGIPLLIEGEARAGSLDYARFAAGASHTVHARSVDIAALLDVRAVSPGAPSDVHPALGDEHAIPGLRWGAGRGRARVIAGVDAAYLLASGFIRVRLRTGAAHHALDDIAAARWVAGADLSAGWQSPIGTVEAGLGAATRGGGRFDISVGRRF